MKHFRQISLKFAVSKNYFEIWNFSIFGNSFEKFAETEILIFQSSSKLSFSLNFECPSLNLNLERTERQR